MRHLFVDKIPGILLALSIAICAYFLGKTFPVIGGPVIGITLGIIIASVVKPAEQFRAGIKFTSKTILQLAIILLGFEMSMQSVIEVGKQSIVVILLTLTASFLTAYFVGKRLKIQKNLAILIGVGTAICGGSAIAAAAPTIDAEDHDISFAISTIFFFNIIAVFLFPFVGHLFHMSDPGFGMWAGTAINDTSSVVAAGYSYSNAAGDFATIVKLTRSLMIVPVTLALAFLTAGSKSDAENHFHFVTIFPWFVVGFLVAAVVNSMGWIPTSVSAGLGHAGKFFIIMAMAAIGLNTNIAAFKTTGPRALLLGASTWLAVIVSSLGVQGLLRMW